MLSNSSRYGVTTSQHQHAVNWSVNHLDQVAVPVPCVSYPRDHDANITFLVTEQARLLKEAQRCMQENSVTYRERVARERYYAQIRYQAFFGIRRKVTELPEDAWQAAQDRACCIETPDPVRDAKRLVAKARREETHTLRLAAVVEEYRAVRRHNQDAWRAYDTGRPYPKAYYALPRVDKQRVLSAWGEDGALLRVNGDKIETSKGDRIPLDHAPRLWAFVQAVRASGQAYVSNGHAERAGEYKVSRVDADGTLHVGCHHISYSELERMARQLGLIGQEG